MRTFSPATAAHFARRSAFSPEVLFWISPRNRSTGIVEPIGFWSGEDHRVFSIEGQDRTYYGAGEFISIEPLRRQLGIKTRTQKITFSAVSPGMMALMAQYDVRHAPVELHRALFDPLTEALIDEPHVILTGFVDKAASTRAPKNEGGAQVTIDVANHARALTRGLSRYRSDATLRARDPSDAIRQYASIADSVDTPWGRNAASGSNSAGGAAQWGPRRSSGGGESTPPATGGGSWPRR